MPTFDVANILSKVFLHRFVQSYEFTVPDDYTYRVQPLPIPKPRDGLPLTLTPLRAGSNR